MKVDTLSGHLLFFRLGFRPAGLLVLAVVLFTGSVHIGCRNQSAKESIEQVEATSRRQAVERAEAVRQANLERPAGVRLVLDGLRSADPLISGTAVLRLLQARPAWTLQLLEPEREAAAAQPASRLVVSRVLASTDLTASEPGHWPVCEWADREADEGVRSFAAAACARRGTDQGDPRPKWKALMNDPSWVVRGRVVGAVAHDVDTRAHARAFLAWTAENDPHPTVRRAARRYAAHEPGRANAENDN